MRMWRAIIVAILLAAVLGLGGCKKKKPPVPPQAQAPTVTPQPQPAPPTPPPPASGEPNRPQPEVAPPAGTETTEPPPAPVNVPKPKRKARNNVAKKPTPPPAPAPEKPSRTVVEQGGTRPSAAGQLSASLPQDAAIHQKLNTAQLLEATEYNLKNISRPLSADEQAMVQHIRSYVQQSREASKDGDTERAYNLAMKAHLLSDELVKP